MKKVRVETTIVQWLEVPESTDKQGVLNFLAEQQSFRDAFVGISDPEQTFRIIDVEVVSEEVGQIGEECFDD